MSEVKQSLNKIQIVGCLSELNMKVETKEVTLKGNGTEKKVTCKTIGKADFRNPSMTVEAKIGDNVIFNGVEVSGVGHVQIGNYCQFGSGILIVSSNHDYDNGESIPYGAYSIDKGIIIEDFV